MLLVKFGITGRAATVDFLQENRHSAGHITGVLSLFFQQNLGKTLVLAVLAAVAALTATAVISQPLKNVWFIACLLQASLLTLYLPILY